MTERRAYYLMGCVLLVAGWLGVVLSLAAEGLYWLKNNAWPNWSLDALLDHAGYARSTLSWQGIQHLIDLLFRAPISIAFLVLGIGVGWALTSLNEGEKSA